MLTNNCNRTFLLALSAFCCIGCFRQSRTPDITGFITALPGTRLRVESDTADPLNGPPQPESGRESRPANQSLQLAGRLSSGRLVQSERAYQTELPTASGSGGSESREVSSAEVITAFCGLTNVAADKHFSDAASPQWLYCACS